MKRVLVRYKTKPERVQENEALVAEVYRQLRQRAPAGFRYATVKLADGATFVHLAEIEAPDGATPLPGIEAFKEFQKDLKDRCVEPPQASDVTLIGDYRLFGD